MIRQAEARPGPLRFERNLDRINSAKLIQQARQVYWRYWQRGATLQASPKGVVLQGDTGQVVFDWPTLLPDEHFVPAEWIQGRATRSSNRNPRQRSGPETPWSTPQA